MVDIKKYVSEEDWKKIKESLEKCRKNEDWWNFFWLAMSMKLIFFGRRKELGLDDEVYNGMKKQLDGYINTEKKFGTFGKKKSEFEWYRSRGTWERYMPQAMAVKILFPKKANEIISEDIFQEMIGFLEFCRIEKNWADYAARGMALVTLFPNRRKEMKFSERDWKGMVGLLKEYKKDKDWWHLPSLATKMKLMYPEKEKELMSILDKQVWNGIESYLDMYRKQNEWIYFTVESGKVRILQTSPTIVKLVLSSNLMNYIPG